MEMEQERHWVVGVVGGGDWRPRTFQGKKDGEREEDERWEEQHRERGRKDDGISLLCFCLRWIWTQNRCLQVSVWFSFREESMFVCLFFLKKWCILIRNARDPKVN